MIREKIEAVYAEESFFTPSGEMPQFFKTATRVAGRAGYKVSNTEKSAKGILTFRAESGDIVLASSFSKRRPADSRWSITAFDKSKGSLLFHSKGEVFKFVFQNITNKLNAQRTKKKAS